jgi:beta-aspartyl-peptidase (threonine type)
MIQRLPTCNGTPVRVRWCLLLGTSAALVLLANTGHGGWRNRRCSPPVCPPAYSLASLPPAQTVEQAVRQVLDEQVAAWNRGDLKGFMAGYWSSEELSFFSGSQRTRGWQATLDRYVERYQSKGQEMGQLTFRDLEIEQLGPDSALARGRWQLKRSKDAPGGLFTLIFKRLPEGWRIVHDHTSS